MKAATKAAIKAAIKAKQFPGKWYPYCYRPRSRRPGAEMKLCVATRAPSGL